MKKEAASAYVFLLIKKPSIMATCIVGAVIALLAPTKVLTEVGFLSSYVDALQKIIPLVDGFRRRSNFPEVSALYFSIMAPLGVAWLIEAIRSPRETLISDASMLYKSIVQRERSRYFLITVSCCFCICIFLIFYFNPGFDFLVMPINRSRFALALFGPLFSSAPFLTLAAIVHIFRMASTGRRAARLNANETRNGGL